MYPQKGTDVHDDNVDDDDCNDTSQRYITVGISRSYRSHPQIPVCQYV